MLAQLPPALVQAWHVVQLCSQQKPSVQAPDAHWDAIEQPWPLLRRQAPPPLQVLAPVQVSSSAFLTEAQVPMVAARLQAMQLPMHVVSQHTPSTHLPLTHWLPLLQPWPLSFLHPPLPSHALGVTQAPTGTLSD